MGTAVPFFNALKAVSQAMDATAWDLGIRAWDYVLHGSCERPTRVGGIFLAAGWFRARI